jgi:cysteine/O-acetylserine efflux protein
VQIQWAALAVFVVATTFTPGPNNIAAMSLGASFGYGRSLRFLAGMTVGFFAVMAACAAVASVVLTAFPGIEGALRAAGALYIAWLALHTLRNGLGGGPASQKPVGFAGGFVLQLLNPKVILYGLTLYSTFLSAISGRSGWIGLSAVVFALVGFAAVSLWAVAGSSLSALLSKDAARRAVTVALSVLLLYSAVECSGLIDLLSRAIAT